MISHYMKFGFLFLECSVSTKEIVRSDAYFRKASLFCLTNKNLIRNSLKICYSPSLFALWSELNGSYLSTCKYSAQHVVALRRWEPLFLYFMGHLWLPLNSCPAPLILGSCVPPTWNVVLCNDASLPWSVFSTLFTQWTEEILQRIHLRTSQRNSWLYMIPGRRDTEPVMTWRPFCPPFSAFSPLLSLGSLSS